MKKTLIALLIVMVSTLAYARGTSGGRGGSHGGEDSEETQAPNSHASDEEEREQPPRRPPPAGYDTTRINHLSDTGGGRNDAIARKIFFALVAGAIALWIVMLVMR
jgi:hypothetical protein